MDKKIYFISDLHLGATYLDRPLDYEKRVVRFLRSIKDDVSELYLLGDILDYWYEYRTVVPRGFVRFFGALADLADSGVKVTWFIGNHDIWIFDYIPSELGVEVIDGSVVRDIAGKRFFLSHGDGVGKLPGGFRFMRSIFRNRFCQMLFSAVHPRWTIPFAHRWSLHSRDFSPEIPKFAGAENEPLVAFAREYQLTHDPVDYFVFGHRHVLVDYHLPEGGQLVILGDWIHHFSYGVFDGKAFSLGCFDD